MHAYTSLQPLKTPPDMMRSWLRFRAGLLVDERCRVYSNRTSSSISIPSTLQNSHSLLKAPRENQTFENREFASFFNLDFASLREGLVPGERVARSSESPTSQPRPNFRPGWSAIDPRILQESPQISNPGTPRIDDGIPGYSRYFPSACVAACVEIKQRGKGMSADLDDVLDFDPSKFDDDEIEKLEKELANDTNMAQDLQGEFERGSNPTPIFKWTFAMIMRLSHLLHSDLGVDLDIDGLDDVPAATDQATEAKETPAGAVLYTFGSACNAESFEPIVGHRTTRASPSNHEAGGGRSELTSNIQTREELLAKMKALQAEHEVIKKALESDKKARMKVQHHQHITEIILR
eukprot:16479-Amorphochlora_amoeboformis.AAC.1